MRSNEVRRLAQAAAAEGADEEVWAALAARCSAIAEQLQHWDLVYILQAFTAAGVQNKPLFTQLGGVLCSKASKLPPKRVLDLLAVYEANNLRLRSLYVELFHTLIRLSRSMYAEELSLTLQALARYGLGNPTVVTHLVQAVLKQIKDFRLRYLCGITGALGSMHAVPEPLLLAFDAQARLEVETVPLQELLENMQAFPLLEFSWAPYEALNSEELLRRTAALETWEDVDQFADPFEAMRFLQARGQLSDGFLLALSQWCLRGVHQPNVRAERRPTSRQLVAVYDQCRERGIEGDQALQDAMAYYVESAGGQWAPMLAKPLRYKRKRRYIRTEDPLEGLELPELPTKSLLPIAGESQASSDLWALPATDEAPAQADETDAVVASYAAAAEAAIAEAKAKGLNLFNMPPMPRRKKPSRRASTLTEEETTILAHTRSRKGPRPRHRVDPFMKKSRRADMPKGPLWYHGGTPTRPTYQQGRPSKNYPYAGVPPGHCGAGWVLRR